MKLSLVPGEYAVLRYPATAKLPDWVEQSAFSAVTRTREELSVLVEQRLVQPGYEKSETGFAAIKVEGPLDFALTGIMAKLTVPLAKARISIFAISTFDTDYLLVRTQDLAAAQLALTGAGFAFTRS